MDKGQGLRLWLEKRRKLLKECGFYTALADGNKKRVNELSRMTFEELEKESKKDNGNVMKAIVKGYVDWKNSKEWVLEYRSWLKTKQQENQVAKNELEE